MLRLHSAYRRRLYAQRKAVGRRLAPVAVLLSGCVLVGAGVAGVARVDAPLRAAAIEQQRPPERHDVQVTWQHRTGDCPPEAPART